MYAKFRSILKKRIPPLIKTRQIHRNMNNSQHEFSSMLIFTSHCR